MVVIVVVIVVIVVVVVVVVFEVVVVGVPMVIAVSVDRIPHPRMRLSNAVRLDFRCCFTTSYNTQS
jgi:hypothetical protein